MAHKDELVGAKIPPALAAALGDDFADSLSGAGTTQGGATVIAASVSNFTTVASNSGAVLPTASGRGVYTVMNNGANALKVYPASGEKINGGSANAAFSVSAGKCAFFRPVGQQWFAALSA